MAVAISANASTLVSQSESGGISRGKLLFGMQLIFLQNRVIQVNIKLLAEHFQVSSILQILSSWLRHTG